MKDFSCCPKCHGVLLNEYTKVDLTTEVLHRICGSKIDHYFKATLDTKTNQVIRALVVVSTSPYVKAIWRFENKTLAIMKGQTLHEMVLHEETQLPYFEPDFSNYDRLISKLKTYIIFS